MKEQISQIKLEIKAIVGDKPVKIVAASKMQTIETLNELPKCGLKVVGENKVQELLSKYTPESPLEWQFIGSLQTNKVKYLVDKVTLIQSVDSISLVKEIEKQSAKINKIMPILIEVNFGREEQKSGILPEELYNLIDFALTMPHVKINGLMTVMPVGADEKLYKGMDELFNKCKVDYPTTEWKYLSMGMSGDYQTAVKYGSNMVRIGEKIFGKRNYNQ